MERSIYDHRRVAWCYETIASLHSFGAIARVKARQIAALHPGERVLYAGVGAGEDALLAARAGFRPECLDVSRAMLDRLEARFAREGLRANTIHCDVLCYRPEQLYDVVIANFMLNQFSQSMMIQVLARLCSMIAPGGRLMIADFRPVPAKGAVRWLHELNYRPLNWAAWALGLCALHPIYDYAEAFPKLGLELSERIPEPPFAGAPSFYETLIARGVGRDSR